MYKLIGTPVARPFRVLWALEELGLDYEVVPAPPRSDEALQYNPSGKVPVLVEDDDIVIDSVAIVQYLADKHGNLTYPAGTIERAKQDSFTQFACDDIDGILWTMAKHSFVLPEEIRAQGVRQACEYDFARSMSALDARLGNNEYVMGDRFTIPDLIIGHCAGWADNAKFEIPKGNVSDYIKRLRDRPAYQRSDEIRDSYRSK